MSPTVLQLIPANPQAYWSGRIIKNHPRDDLRKGFETCVNGVRQSDPDGAQSLVFNNRTKLTMSVCPHLDLN